MAASIEPPSSGEALEAALPGVPGAGVSLAHPSGAKESRRTLARILQLWRLYAWLDCLWMMRDPKTFAWYILSEVLLNLGAVTTTLLLAERFDGIGPWSTLQVVFMLSYAIVVNGLDETFFGYNIGFISRRIGRGQLDHVLVQPQPLWLTLLTEGFTPTSGLALLLPGVGLMAWSLGALGQSISPGWLALLLLNLIASTVIVLAFSYLWSSMAFWAPRAAEEVSSSARRVLDSLKPFPLDGIGAALAGGLLTAVPAGFVAWYPARALLGIDTGPYAAFVTPLAAVVFAALAAWVFRKGLNQYGRTGSQRYLALGHRR